MYIELNDKFEGLNKELQDTRKELKSEIRENRNSINNLESKIDINRNSINNLESKVDNNRISINNLESKVDNINSKFDDMEANNAKRHIDITGEIKDMKSSINRIEINTAENWRDIAKLKSIK